MSKLQQLLAVLSSTVLLSPAVVMALPVPDATVGTRDTELAPGFVQIDGGTTVGQNLFHSFDSFNIGTGEFVYFFSPADVNHIFSRVTGIEASFINGVLGTFGSNADLFLMNPNGVVFGPEASLDVQGSFLVTTADAISLGNNGMFSTADPDSDRLLAVNPSVFFFNSLAKPGRIVNQSAFFRRNFTNPSLTGTGLQVLNGEALILLGGDVVVDGGQLNAPGGRIEIGAVSDIGEVTFSVEEDTLIFQDDVQKGNVSVVNGSRVNTISGEGGDIAINARNLTVSNFSRIASGIDSGLGTATSQAGNIEIDVIETVLLLDGSTIVNGVIGLGAGGNVIVSAENISILNGSQIGTAGLGSSDIGDVTLKALDTIIFSGRNPANNNPSGILASVASLLGFVGQGNGGNINLSAQKIFLADAANIASAVISIPNEFDRIESSGDSGNISITANDVLATEGARINSSILETGTGQAGNVMIEADNKVLFEGIDERNQSSGGIFSIIDNNAQGSGGNIEISARNLEISNGAEVNASTFGIGDSGRIHISSDSLLLDGTARNSFIQNDIGEGAIGNALGIVIKTGSLQILNGSQISSTINGVGNSQGIFIHSTGDILFRGSDQRPNGRFTPSAIFAGVLERGQGNSGDIIIQANSLTLAESSQFSSTTKGRGNAGDIIVIVDEEALFENSNILSEVTSIDEVEEGSGGIGDGGSIIISADTLELLNGSSLLADTENQGNAGNITLDVRENISLSGEGPGGLFQELITPSQISTTVDGQGATGEGGNININAGSITIADGGFINSGTSGAGTAGNINIVVNDDISLTDGRISVISSSDRKAGDLNIMADGLTLDLNSVLTAESATVNGGNIFLTLNALLVLRNNSQITATGGTAQAGGNGGNIIINVPFIVAVPSENSDITANAFSGSGGQVNITADGVFGIEPRPNLTPLSDITASSGLGVVGGTVTLDSPDTSFIQNSLTELPETLVNPDALVAGSCVARNQETGGTFVITGNGLADTPSSSSAAYSIGTVQTPNINTVQLPSQIAIVEPTSIYQTADGRLIMSKEC